MSISDAKWTVLRFFCAARMTSFSALHIGHLPGRQLFQLLPSLVHCCCCIQIFYRLDHGNEFVHKIVVTQRVEPLLRNVIIVIF